MFLLQESEGVVVAAVAAIGCCWCSAPSFLCRCSVAGEWGVIVVGATHSAEIVLSAVSACMSAALVPWQASEGVIVVAATNFPEILDKALVRPGRFDRHVVVPAPDVEGRKQILESHFKVGFQRKPVSIDAVLWGLL
jgi:hypothetical protein